MFLAISFAGSINAQVLLNETFSNLNGVFPVGWTRFNVDALIPNTNVAYVNNAWIVRDDLDLPADTVAISTSWYTPAGTANDWMFTPAVTLPAVGAAVLTFEGKAYDPTYADGYEVRIMNAAPTAGNILTSTVLLTIPAETDAFSARSVSLSAYAGQTVYIGFRNNSTDMFVLAIDDVKVENFITPTPEVSITRVTPGQYTAIPKGQVTSFPVSAVVNNSGTGAAATINLTTSVFKLPNTTTPVYTGTGSTSNLATGASATINASTAFTPAAPINGEYVFRSVVSGNTGSVTNDTFFYSVVVNDSVYARDLSTADNAIGVTGAGNTAILGNTFLITANSTLTTVLFATNGVGTGPALGDSTQVLVYATTAGVPTGVPVASSAIYIYGATDTGTVVRTIAINGASGFALTAGTYFVGIKEFFRTDNLGILISDGIFTPNTTYAQVGIGTWTPLENYGFPSAAIVRANVRTVCAVSSTIASTNATCTNGSGTATVTAANGTAPYVYAWSNSQNAATATNLVAGNYTVTVTDASGCSVSSSVTVASTTTTITTNTPTTTNSSCGGATGSASVNPNNGTAPYSYLWNNAGNTQTISNVAAGSYSVTISDANGCTGNVSGIVVNNPNAPTASISTSTSVACNGGATGQATVAATGGTAPFTFTWSNGALTAATTGLAAGVYTATVSDAASCLGVTSVTISQPTAVSVTNNTSATANISCFGGNNGAAAVTVAGGTPNYSFNWSNGASTASISGLTAGSYSATVTDANLCVSTFAITLTQPATALAVSATHNDISCNGSANGSATATGAGGTAPYAYAWSNNANGAIASGLVAGNYTVTATDANGCVAAATAVTVTEPSAINTSATVTNASAFGATNGAVNISVGGGTGAYTFLWSNGATTEDLSGVAAGTYTVTVSDANGCTDTQTETISQPTTVGVSNGNINISVFPNPADATATLTISLVNSSEVTIQITNVTGQVIRTINDANVLNNQYTLNTTEWAAGVYFVRVTAGNDTATYRLTRK